MHDIIYIYIIYILKEVISGIGKEQTNIGIYRHIYGSNGWNCLVFSTKITSNNVVGYGCNYFVPTKQEEKKKIEKYIFFYN